eukprot:CFRG7810T1
MTNINTGFEKYSTVPTPTPKPYDANTVGSWCRNIERAGGGFWADPQWYDKQIDRRLPLASTMIEEMTFAMPPCGGARVADLCAGSGRVALQVLQSYPNCYRLSLIDQSQERLHIAQTRLMDTSGKTLYYLGSLNIFDESTVDTLVLPGSPYDVITAGLALHVLVSPHKHYKLKAKTIQEESGNASHSVEQNIEVIYEVLLKILLRSLASGGHLIVGDHCGKLGLFEQLTVMKRAGFVDVDCSWRQQDCFVFGGRKPTV